MKRLKIKIITVASMVLVFALPVYAEHRPVYVERDIDDCINTYTLKMIVAASKRGDAVGEFDGTSMLMVHKLINRNCVIVFYQRGDGGVVERRLLNCMFSNPLDR